jgi:hypothetical protein
VRCAETIATISTFFCHCWLAGPSITHVLWHRSWSSDCRQPRHERDMRSEEIKARKQGENRKRSQIQEPPSVSCCPLQHFSAPSATHCSTDRRIHLPWSTGRIAVCPCECWCHSLHSHVPILPQLWTAARSSGNSASQGSEDAVARAQVFCSSCKRGGEPQSA